MENYDLIIVGLILFFVELVIILGLLLKLDNMNENDKILVYFQKIHNK
jgi:hypothetical protein